MGSGTWIGLAVLVAISCALTRVMISISTRNGWVSHPRPDRWGQRTVALMGGLAMSATWLLGCIAWALGLFPGVRVPSVVLVVTLGIFPVVLSIVGFVDDRKGMDPRTKLSAQAFCALAVLMVMQLVYLPRADLGAQALLFGVGGLFVVGLSNSINLLDNMDGLAAGVVAVGSAGLGSLAAMLGGTDIAFASFLLCAICIGFLVWNGPIVRPAQVFMGDCGSLMLGLVMGLLIVWFALKTRVDAAVFWPVLPLFVAVPLWDTTFVVVRRLIEKRPVMLGGRDHLSHKFMIVNGSSERQVFWLFLGIAGITSGFAVEVALRHMAFISIFMSIGIPLALAWLASGLKEPPKVDPSQVPRKKTSKKR